MSLHPKYGGYFAYRAVLIFPEVILPPDFKEQRAPMLLTTIEKQDEAVRLYNDHWWEGSFVTAEIRSKNTALYNSNILALYQRIGGI